LVIRTGLSKRRKSSAPAVRSYKVLAKVECPFGSLKTVDLKVRPIHRRLEGQVRPHPLLCMLAQYVESDLIGARWPIWFADENQAAKAARDPAAPARRSAAAL